MSNLQTKYNNLKRNLKQVQSVLVAYSGGVDSALVLKVARDVLQDNVLGVTADSPSVPRAELQIARRIADKIGAKHLLLKTEEFAQENYLQNPANRCYFCKTELYSKLMQIAKQHQIKTIANGANLDDLGDYRPGLQAADEFQVVSPLKDAKFNKAEVRELARQLGLEIWDKPASPCLSSRIPYGSRVTVEKLRMVEQAENFLKTLGIKELRVRHFGEKARIEVSKENFYLIENSYNLILKQFQAFGFKEIVLAEFKSGSLNTVLDL